MKREFIDENEDLIQKEKQLKKQNKITSILIIILLVVAIILAFEGYTGKRSSWFFNDVLHIGMEDEKIIQDTTIVKEDDSPIFELKNQVDGGSTNYIFKLSGSDWTILETDKITGSNVLNVDISSHLGVGSTEVTLVTEFYGSFGNLIESCEQKFTITK